MEDTQPKELWSATGGMNKRNLRGLQGGEIIFFYDKTSEPKNLPCHVAISTGGGKVSSVGHVTEAPMPLEDTPLVSLMNKSVYTRIMAANRF